MKTRTLSSFTKEQAIDVARIILREGLQDDHSAWQTDENRIAIIAEDFYQELFTTSNLRHMDNVLSSIARVVTDGMNETLTQPYTKDEVCKALFQMHPSKALGLDGM